MKIAAYRDIQTGKWLVERNGLEAIDSSLVNAVAILLRMETEL